MRSPIRGETLAFTLSACAAALTLLVLLPGAIVTAFREAPADPDAIAAEQRSTAEANRRLLNTTMRSYALVAHRRTPALDIHVFGLPGAPSLNAAVESRLLSLLKTAGGFDHKAAFAPPQTAPGHRWPTSRFIPDHTIEEADESAGDAERPSPTPAPEGRHAARRGPAPNTDLGARTLSIDTEVIAAGGHFVLTALTQRSPQPQTILLLTDLADRSTIDVRRLFAADIAPADVSADVTGTLTVDGTRVSGTDLTPLGRSVAHSLHTPLELSPPEDLRSPDFSCALLPCVALTYDDGPGDARTEHRILDAADRAGIRVTYFFLGSSIRTSPEVARDVVAAGHEVDNHTNRHLRLDTIPTASVRKEIRRTDKSLSAIGAGDHALVRPPYGSLDRRSAHAVHRPSIIWDVDTGDWHDKKPKRIIRRVKAQTRPGSVVLMHSIHPSTAKAAPDVFAAVADKGLYAVTVRELFSGIPWEPNGSYFCRGYDDDGLCSNPEHPTVQKN